MVKLEYRSIKALVYVISGDAPAGQSSLSPYRTGPKLIEFFKLLSFEEGTYDASFGSRQPYVQAKLEEANGTSIMARIIASAVDPRDFLKTAYDVKTVIDYLNEYLDYDGFKIVPSGKGYTVVPVGQFDVNSSGNIKNLIFASNGPKPELVLDDAMSNSIRIVKNEEYCLIYTRPISERGLWWSELVTWANEERDRTEEQLRKRLRNSLDSDPERLLFDVYHEYAKERLGADFPALIPQVYFHYDPKTLQQLNGNKRIARQRMDFLLLFPFNARIVLEVDGQHHYSLKSGQSSPIYYADMVAEDRKLKLLGYEVYRFGGYEFVDAKNPKQTLIKFFVSLFDKHKVQRKSVAKSRVVEPADDLPF